MGSQTIVLSGRGPSMSVSTEKNVPTRMAIVSKSGVKTVRINSKTRVMFSVQN